MPLSVVTIDPPEAPKGARQSRSEVEGCRSVAGPRFTVVERPGERRPQVVVLALQAREGGLLARAGKVWHGLLGEGREIVAMTISSIVQLALLGQLLQPVLTKRLQQTV